MGSKRSYFTCNFLIFLAEDFALPLIQLLLLIFSKRLDNLFSVCGALDFFFSFGVAFRFTAFSFLFIVFFNLFPNRFLQYVIHLFSICFSFTFAFRSNMLRTSNFYMCVLDFIFTCHFCFK